MYANTRGLRGKLVSLNQILSENRPHLFLLTETQLRSNTGINVKEYVLKLRKNYTFLSCFISKQNNGNLII